MPITIRVEREGGKENFRGRRECNSMHRRFNNGGVGVVLRLADPSQITEANSSRSVIPADSSRRS